MPKYKAVENETELAKGYGGTVLQVGSYKTSTAQNVASGGSILMEYDTVVRLMSIDGDAWVSRVSDSGSGEGLFIPIFSEVTMLIYAGETLYINDATVNVVAIAV